MAVALIRNLKLFFEKKQTYRIARFDMGLPYRIFRNFFFLGYPVPRIVDFQSFLIKQKFSNKKNTNFSALRSGLPPRQLYIKGFLARNFTGRSFKSRVDTERVETRKTGTSLTCLPRSFPAPRRRDRVGGRGARRIKKNIYIYIMVHINEERRNSTRN